MDSVASADWPRSRSIREPLAGRRSRCSTLHSREVEASPHFHRRPRQGSHADVGLAGLCGLRGVMADGVNGSCLAIVTLQLTPSVRYRGSASTAMSTAMSCFLRYSICRGRTRRLLADWNGSACKSISRRGRECVCGPSPRPSPADDTPPPAGGARPGASTVARRPESSCRAVTPPLEAGTHLHATHLIPLRSYPVLPGLAR